MELRTLVPSSFIAVQGLTCNRLDCRRWSGTVPATHRIRYRTLVVVVFAVFARYQPQGLQQSMYAPSPPPTLPPLPMDVLGMRRESYSPGLKSYVSSPTWTTTATSGGFRLVGKVWSAYGFENGIVLTCYRRDWDWTGTESA
uniref:Uncharacterized protein n=1 Tax=Mycena chlorophos TaxID=658473 RepID=A0ABQ0KVV8_MYCCL|nr:predicted protein [Mycena chlorophos]